MENVTLRVVAAEAGVSLSTASAAMRGEKIVKPATRAKIEAAAKKLGYQPNTVASVLASHRHRNSRRQILIAWLAGYRNPKGNEWKVSAQLAAAEAEKRGIQLEIHNLKDPAEARQLLRELEARGCDGIIWGYCDFPSLPKLPWNRFSVVSTLEDRTREGFDIVRTSQFRGTIRLLRRIKEAGYKRIGICLLEHSPPIFDDEERYGAASTFSCFDLPQKQRIPILRIPFIDPDTDDKLVAWMGRYEPDVVVSSHIGVMQVLEQRGYKVPQDVSYASLHVSRKSQGLLAGCLYNREVIPEHAVRVLMEKIRHSMRGISVHPQETIIDSEILAGASCPMLVGDSED